ncbi:MAG: accessory gene regulator B family protein [Clostridiales bacterium]|nr:accessory gene regulator B family protein [Clostridiales bacterium]
MRFIRKWSFAVANGLARTLDENHEKRHVLYYGAQIIIGGIVKFALLVLVTLVLGVFVPTFTVLGFFAAVRIFAGGYHMDDYTRCAVVSISLFVILGFIVKYTWLFWSPQALLVLIIITFAVSLFSVIKYAPADTPYKPITKPEQLRKLKTVSVIMVCIWFAAAALLLYLSLTYYVLAGCIGVLMASFIISPAGYKFFDLTGGKK